MRNNTTEGLMRNNTTEGFSLINKLQWVNRDIARDYCTVKICIPDICESSRYSGFHTYIKHIGIEFQNYQFICIYLYCMLLPWWQDDCLSVILCELTFSDGQAVATYFKLNENRLRRNALLFHGVNQEILYGYFWCYLI